MPDTVDYSPLKTCPACGGSMIPGDILCFGCWYRAGSKKRGELLKAAGGTDQKTTTPCADEPTSDGFGFMASVPTRQRRRGRR